MALCLVSRAIQFANSTAAGCSLRLCLVQMHKLGSDSEVLEPSVTPEAKHCQEKMLRAQSQSWSGVNQPAPVHLQGCTHLAPNSALPSLTSLNTERLLFDGKEINLFLPP